MSFAFQNSQVKTFLRSSSLILSASFCSLVTTLSTRFAQDSSARLGKKLGFTFKNQNTNKEDDWFRQIPCTFRLSFWLLAESFSLRSSHRSRRASIWASPFKFRYIELFWTPHSSKLLLKTLTQEMLYNFSHLQWFGIDSSSKEHVLETSQDSAWKWFCRHLRRTHQASKQHWQHWQLRCKFCRTFRTKKPRHAACKILAATCAPYPPIHHSPSRRCVFGLVGRVCSSGLFLSRTSHGLENTEIYRWIRWSRIFGTNSMNVPMRTPITDFIGILFKCQRLGPSLFSSAEISSWPLQRYAFH